jgi:GntR family transcriptional regulator/MocR family aminotransferase
VLAQDLGISRSTVEAAYTQLAAEGLLQRVHGSGSFLRPPRFQGAVATLPLRLPAQLSARGREVLRIGGCLDPLEPLPFAAGSPDLRDFPWPTWERLARRRAPDAAELARYQPPQGQLRLRELLAEHLGAARGVRARAEQVLVLTSSQQALHLLAHLLLDPGDCVWVEDPGYRGASAAMAAAGARLQPVPVDAEGLQPRPGLPAPKLILLTPAHQYPLGVRLSPARRAEVLALAQAHGSWVMEDDYDSEFFDAAQALPALQSQDADGRVIYLGTFSKTLMPSLRLAYAVLPPALVEAAVASRSLHDGHGNGWFQALVADFMEGGHYASHLRQMRAQVGERRQALLEGLARHLPWAQPVAPQACGLQVCVALPSGQEVDLSRQAARLGVQTPSLAALCALAPLEGWLLGFAALRPEEIGAALRRLGGIQPRGQAREIAKSRPTTLRANR